MPRGRLNTWPLASWLARMVTVSADFEGLGGCAAAHTPSWALPSNVSGVACPVGAAADGAAGAVAARVAPTVARGSDVGAGMV